MWASIKKFGLSHCDMATMLWNVTFLLRPLGLEVDSRNKNRISRLVLLISATVAASYLYVYLVSMIWFVFWRCRETGDLIAAIVVFSLGVSSEIGNTKLACIMFHRQKVRELVDLYLECDSLIDSNSRFYKNLMLHLRYVKKRAMIFWFVIIGNGVVYCTKPLISPGRHLMEDLFILYGLEPSTESPNYEISFALMTGGSILTVYLPANITALLIITIGYIEAQMMALKEEVLCLWTDAHNHYNTQLFEESNRNTHHHVQSYDNDINLSNKDKIINEYIYVRLQQIIKLHVTNINLLIKAEYIFRGAIALEFILLSVGLIVELLGGLENTYLEVPFALMQVAMDCLSGQRLMESSTSFEMALYASNWENFETKNMKMILIMLTVSQKTMNLSAGGVIVLNYSSLMMVIKSIYSAYTTLRTTMD